MMIIVDCRGSQSATDSSSATMLIIGHDPERVHVQIPSQGMSLHVRHVFFDTCEV